MSCMIQQKPAMKKNVTKNSHLFQRGNERHLAREHPVHSEAHAAELTSLSPAASGAPKDGESKWVLNQIQYTGVTVHHFILAYSCSTIPSDERTFVNINLCYLLISWFDMWFNSQTQVSVQNSGPMVLHKCLALATCIRSKSSRVWLLFTEFA